MHPKLRRDPARLVVELLNSFGDPPAWQLREPGDGGDIHLGVCARICIAREHFCCARASSSRINSKHGDSA
jgi:hypothetical protein